ncbi:MAG: cilia- and flagella-associated protein 77 [Akkermansiaceae bacterium]|nr:cilia- and flagella-associated protein 77 [Akkermansiaceae bacterium]
MNKITFGNPSMEKTFGVPKQSDPEGARDLTMVWQEHAANPDDVPGEYVNPRLFSGPW